MVHIYISFIPLQHTCEQIGLGAGLLCLMPLSTIVHLYCLLVLIVVETCSTFI